MTIRLSSKPVIKSVGGAKVLLVSPDGLNLISPDDLPGGGGSPSRDDTVQLVPNSAYVWPGVGSPKHVAAAMPVAGTLRAYLLPAGDYTNVCPALVAGGGTVVSAKAALYEMSATGYTGAKKKELGSISITASSSRVGKLSPIGVLLEPALVALWSNGSQGLMHTVEPTTMVTGYPYMLGALATGSPMEFVQMDAISPGSYPATTPATLPPMAHKAMGEKVSIPLFLFSV